MKQEEVKKRKGKTHLKCYLNVNCRKLPVGVRIQTTTNIDIFLIHLKKINISSRARSPRGSYQCPVFLAHIFLISSKYTYCMHQVCCVCCEFFFLTQYHRVIVSMASEKAKLVDVQRERQIIIISSVTCNKVHTKRLD